MFQMSRTRRSMEFDSADGLSLFKLCDYIIPPSQQKWIIAIRNNNNKLLCYIAVEHSKL